MMLLVFVGAVVGFTMAYCTYRLDLTLQRIATALEKRK
jgi:ABC-type dipeptide/oligopeptide/nickel transport system permease subunit